MAGSPRGPLDEFKGQIIAKSACKGCAGEVAVKVNSAGWPYVICPHSSGCGYQEKSQSAVAAGRILNDRSLRWVKGVKEPVLVAMEATPKPEAVPDAEPELENEPDNGWIF